MFCNADLFPSPDISRRDAPFFDEHPAAGAAIGKLLRYDLAADRPTDVIDTAGLVLTRQRRLMPRGEGERDSGQFDEAVEVFAVDGAAPVFAGRHWRRSASRRVSGRELLRAQGGSRRVMASAPRRLGVLVRPGAVAYHGRTTRSLGSSGYMSAIRSFHRNEREKSELVQIHAMKNQWLMLLKNEDGYNFVRDFPFILAREAMVVTHRLLFAPKRWSRFR